MRKVLSFVLVLSLVLGSFGMAFAAPLSDVKGEDFEDAVNVLTELEVVTGYPDGTYKPENIVTRAEMAVIVVRALGLADYAVGTSSFKDMAGHWSNPYVAYAAALGVIAGYPDGTFKPDATVSYDEAATMLVAALGYNADSLVGTWPANFVVKAKSLGILDGIKAGIAGANRGDVALMAFQTLGCDIGKTDKDGVWHANIVEAGPPAVYETLLDRLGAELYAPGGPGTAGDPFVLDDDHADDAIANVREYVGAYVTAYVNSDDEIIAIKEVKSTFLTGEFDASGVATGQVFESDKDYDVTGIASLVASGYFTNGEVDGAFATADTVAGTEYKIAAKVSGKKITDIYSISQWTVDFAFTFDKDMLEDDNINGYDFKLDDNDDIDFNSFALLGADSLDKIAEDDVVYLYLAGGYITKIEVGTETVSGEVTKVNSASDKFTIDGKTYEKGAAYIGADPSAGDEVKFILDYAGEIYDVDAISVADTFAVVLKTVDGAASSASSFGDTPQVELLLSDGTSKIFDAKESSIKDATILNAGLAWQSGAGQKMETGSLIKYGVNANGVITSITALTEVTSEMATASKLSKSGYYAGSKIKSDAVIVVYDGAAAGFTVGGFFGTALDEDDFDVTKLSNVLDTNVRGYFNVNSNGLIDFMVIHASAVTSDAVYGLVTGYGTNNSTAGNYVDMLIDGAKETYNIESTAGISTSTVYEVTFDTAGNVLINTATPIPGGNVAFGDSTATGASFKLTINSNNVITAVTGGTTETGAIDIKGTPKVTLADDVVVYVKDGTKYKIGKLSDVKAALNVIELYDVDADGELDGVVDIVLVDKI